MPTYGSPENSNQGGQAGPKRTPIPDGTIAEVEVQAVKEVQKYIKGEQQTRVEFEFRILDGDHEGQRIWGDTPTTYVDNERCKLWNWTQELLADTPPMPINTDHLVGKRARVEIRSYEYTDKRTGEMKTRNYISTVMRAREATAPLVEPF